MTDDHVHPHRARSGGTLVRFDWGDGYCDTIGWQHIPLPGDRVRCNGHTYRVQRRVFDSNEPDVIIIECETPAP